MIECWILTDNVNPTWLKLILDSDNHSFMGHTEYFFWQFVSCFVGYWAAIFFCEPHENVLLSYSQGPLSANAIIMAFDICFMVECYHELIYWPLAPVVSCYTYNHKICCRNACQFILEGTSFNWRAFPKSHLKAERQPFLNDLSEWYTHVRFIMKVLKMYDDARIETARKEIRKFHFLWTFFFSSIPETIFDDGRRERKKKT